MADIRPHDNEIALKKFLHAGGSSAMAVAIFFGLGDSSAALAQRVTAKLPVTLAIPTAAANLSTTIATLPLPTDPLVQPLPRGNIFTLPLRAAPVPTVPIVQPLSALVAAHGDGPALDAEVLCLATAVYFESMGESLEGQLAVAQVVINRSKSGRYPTSLCGVVKQKAQFSFVRSGRFPRIDAGGAAWRKAQAIARIAAASMAQVLSTDVLWYHADYVAPGWGRRLDRVEKIGAHIFYRA
ncbi:MAG: cell wall hydrolase [Pseudomonadota bacterium]|nr:cell wall hydrolase [Pseudomonadota bacterium]